MDYVTIALYLVRVVIGVILFLIALVICIILFTSSKEEKSDSNKTVKRSEDARLDDDYDQEGFNSQGYNELGKNRKGQYNRYFDIEGFRNGIYSRDGFLSPKHYPIAVTDHARMRMQERMGINGYSAINRLAVDAYRFGKSKRQIKKTSAALVDEIEQSHDNSIVLIYRNYIYIFSSENVLITVYKNEYISL